MSLDKGQTKAQMARKVKEVMKALRTQVKPFSGGEEERRERLRRASEDPFYFFRQYLPHYFNTPFAPFHYELVSMLERRPETEEVLVPVVVAAPREFAKTTITSFGFALHQILFRKRHFLVLISDTNDLAREITEYIYLELCYNERIIQDFGKVVDENLNSSDYVTLTDIRVLARGKGQRIRGRKHHNWRPDLVIVDDIENEAGARNPDIVKKTLDYIKGAVYGAIDQRGNLFIIGTIITVKSALNLMLTSPEEPYCNWTRKTYRAILDDGESLWPAKFPTRILHKQRELMGTVSFRREKMNQPVDDDSYFQAKWFVTYDLGPDPQNFIEKHKLYVVSYLDPSLDTNRDLKALVTVGHDIQNQLIYVLHVSLTKDSLAQVLQSIYDYDATFHYRIVGVETSAFQRILLSHFKDLNKENKRILPVKGYESHLAKEIRISGLSPLIERGIIQFDLKAPGQKELYEQLIYYPSSGIADDGPDALEGAVRICRNIKAPMQYIPLQQRTFTKKTALGVEGQKWRNHV